MACSFFFLLFARNRVNDSRDFFRPTIRTTKAKEAHYSPVTKKSTPILFNENEAFDTSVHTVYSDRPMPNSEETFFYLRVANKTVNNMLNLPVFLGKYARHISLLSVETVQRCLEEMY